MSRRDKPAEERAKSNLIILCADEGQEILTAVRGSLIQIVGQDYGAE